MLFVFIIEFAFQWSMKKLSIVTEKFEYKGYWFLPYSNNSEVAGILTFNPDEKIILELIGGFKKSESPIQSFIDKEQESVIHGITSDSKEITLFNCYPSGSLNLSCRFPITRYSSQYAVVGKHMPSMYEKTFNKIQIHSPLLSIWLYPGVIKNTIQFDKEREIEEISYSVSANKASTLKNETWVDPSFKLLLKGGSFINSSDDLLTVQFGQNTYFEIESLTGKVDIWELLDKALLFLQFISLATLSTCRPSEIILYDYDSYQELTDGRKIYHPIP